MVFIIKSSQVFDQLPSEFTSFFPSEQSLLDGKLSSVLARAGGNGAELMTRVQAESVIQGLQLVLQQKAILSGDFLSANLPQLVSFTTDNFGLKVPQGLFASVPFPSTILEDPILDAMAGVGLKLALTAISAVPVVGKIVALIVNIGMALARLFGAQEADPEVPPLLVPWTKYQRDPDEDLVNNGLIRTTAGTVDWTSVWLPALGGTWSYERAADTQGKEMPGARVFAALDKSTVGWSKGKGLGALPNTLRVAGPVQTIVDTRLRDLAYGGDREAKALWQKQLRFILRGKDRADAEGLGVYNELEVPPTVIDTGAFFPAFAGIAGQMWQQVQQRGNPDMFKVRAFAVRDAWEDYWGAFFDDAFNLLRGLGKKKSADDNLAHWLWAALTPYICVVQANGKRVTLGMRGINRPHPGPLVTPEIFTAGPGPTWLRTNSLYAEFPDGEQAEGPGDMAVMDWNGVIVSPARLNGNSGKLPVKGVRWPTGEESMSLYQRPDKAITTPACNALRRAQMRSLEASLVCAYVRPVPAKGPLGELPAYAAFTQDDELRDRCKEVRELLLKHDSRHDVSLDDVDAIDPPFAARLRAAGVTGEKRPLKKSAGKPLVVPSGKDEPAQQPADGLGFDDVRLLGVPGRRGRSSGRALAIGGAALTSAAALAVYLRHRKQ